MKNTFGQSVAVTLFGESHGAVIGAVVDGLAPGIPVDEGFITPSWICGGRLERSPPPGRKQTPSRSSAAVLRAKPPARP